ncbi:hypothetical protein HELRODRAFT_187260 [Helobdella robusta]|uniref:Haloacid dehalogenase-like hydrolase domain-containing protein 2 n=1 Tax=Helobdella robusta TaxID=6412 RepID=T1FP83_HELRO|nr:hypothetical protein HELRODRAFT_187260 [Helobdella robusta]ESO00098.1 hypothetical protein HELRODRAFT_187260 [Helobdella robusta]
MIFRIRFLKNAASFLPKRSICGVCFDVDGVLAKGPVAISGSTNAIRKLTDEKSRWKVPVAFVTNSSISSQRRADYLSEILNVKVCPTQVVQAHSPLELFTDLRKMFCLLIGQGDVRSLANEVGLSNVCTLEDLRRAYPLLDMVNVESKYKPIDKEKITKNFPRVEAIILLGESVHWESTLQLVIDLLRTNGLPTKLLSKSSKFEQPPLIACNFDLEYMGRAAIPRFGHGAFLVCIEALYKKVTGHSLKFSSLIGKPTEVTFRYAELVLARESQKLGIQSSVKKMYMVGDVPEADIAGANLYQKYVKKLDMYRKLGNDEEECINLANTELPPSRNIPMHPSLIKQTVKRVESLLVCTGVYKQSDKKLEVAATEGRHVYHNRSIDALNFDKSVESPTKIFCDVNEAIEYIVEQNNL